MAIRTAQGNGLDDRRLTNISEPEVYYTNPIDTTGYIRNPTWLTLPTVLSSEQKFVGLFAVYPNANFLALSAAGDYTVNWGDGTTENFSSGVIAYHEYDWNDPDISSDTVGPVTFTGTSDEISRTSHGYQTGNIISFADVPFTVTEVKENRQYYVINATASTFKISEDNLTAINFSSAGPGQILPYKQVIVTITPQGGQNLTSLNFNIKHNQTNLTNYTTGWLDMVISGSSLTSLTISSPTVQNVRHNNLRNASLVSPNQITSFNGTFFNCNELKSVGPWYVSTATTATVNCSSMFRNCFSLRSVSLFDTSKVTDMSFMFANCASLQSIPNFNTQAVTTTNSMFLNATSIKSIPQLNTQNVVDMTSMFNACTNLQYVPLLNTSSCTNMTSMFQNCLSLQSIPLFDTKSVTSMFSTFQNCYSLKRVLLLDTSAVTNMNAMFNGCYNLQEVPLFNTSACTNMTSMFQNCFNLSKIPQFDLTNVTTISSMFNGCYSLQSIPTFTFTNCTTFSSAFLNCASLQDVAVDNASAAITLSNMFQNCYSLQRVSLTGLSTTATNMSSMFRGCNSLQTIPSIPTSFVTDMNNMFNGCSSLWILPPIASTSCTNMSGMFAGCSSLIEAPFLETASVTNMNAMFQNCYSIKSIPTYSTTAVTDIGNMFQNCYSLDTVPALSFPALVTGGTSAFSSCTNLSNFSATSIYQALTLSSTKLSKARLEQVFTNLPAVNTSRALVVVGNYGVDIATTSTGTLTLGSAVITMANTAGITTGSYVSGTGISTGVQVSFQDTGDTVTLNSHGIRNGTYVAFTSITNTTGISTFNPYYVVNTTTNTFQVADTIGGAARPLTTNGTGTIVYVNTVTSIVPNTSVSLAIPASTSTTTAVTFRLLNASIAAFKRWSVTL